MNVVVVGSIDSRTSASGHAGGQASSAVAAAYRADTRALLAARLPVASAIFLSLMAIAYTIEWLNYPQRWKPLSLCYAGFLAMTASGTALGRRWPQYAVEIVLATSVGLAFALAAYLALVQGTAELTLLAMIGLLTGLVVQFPWGARGQGMATLGATAAYLWALYVGARPSLPAVYGLFALLSHALMTVIGARLLDTYRFTAYREAADSARHAADAERADAVKTEFLATVSHELRTPLNIILGYTDLILDGAIDDRAAEVDALARVREQSHQLLYLVQSMLDLNRMEVRGVTVEREAFPLGSLLEKLHAGLPRSWFNPQVKLEWEVDDAAIEMRSDRAKIEVILRNLIHNALKYTENGSVAVRARVDRERRWVEFTVADTGPGIAASDLVGIFEMFRQGSTGAPRGGGVGLGLYIVKRLTDAIGGEISVTSQLGRGTEFTVSFDSVLDDDVVGSSSQS